MRRHGPDCFFTSCITQNSNAQNKDGPFRTIRAMHSMSVGFDRMVPSCKSGQEHSPYYIKTLHTALLIVMRSWERCVQSSLVK